MENKEEKEHADSQWCFENRDKIIKVIGKKNKRIRFQRKDVYNRGVSISKDGLLTMEDVTITPGSRINLEPRIYLTNYGSYIHLVKYCFSEDKKQCEGGYFSFTPKEWFTFWTSIRNKIIDYCDK